MRRRIVIGLLVTAVFLAAGVAGTIVQRMGSVSPASSLATLVGGQATGGDAGGAISAQDSASSGASVAESGVSPTGMPRMAAGAAGTQAKAAMKPSGSATPLAKQMIVTTDAVSMRVSDVRSTVEKVRALASGAGAQIADLTYSAGGNEPTPVTASTEANSGDGATAVGGAPPSAQITLQIPSAKLGVLEEKIGSLGSIIQQTSNQSDVTAQHVDLAARLKNLRAEEARLRTLFARAGDVSDLLDVEQQLSDVRGQIESAQAQLAYLEQQVALSTLTVALSEPGALVRPASGITWGFAEAITQGIQSAAALARTLIVGFLALAPLALLLVLAWGGWLSVRWLRAKIGVRKRGDAEPAEQVA